MKTRKLLSLLLALAMVFSLTVTANADESDINPIAELPETGTMSGKIVILHTNDVHGGIAGYAKVAALKKMYASQGAYVLLLDDGDFIQGDPVVSVSQGATAIELMNLAGYDVATLGNHEFDYGYDNFLTISKEAKFAIVNANILYNGKSAFENNVTFTAPSGKKIGVFGLETPETATKAHPAKIKGLTFLSEKSLFDCAQAQVDALKADGCDYIICLAHLGIADESEGNRSIDVLAKVTGIDVLIDGHSENTLDEYQAKGYDKVGKTLVTSTGNKLKNVGTIVIDEKGAITVQSTTTADLIASEQTVADRAAAIQKEIDDDYGAVFAKTEVLLNGERAPGNRTEETNLGDLITDALAWGAQKNGEKVDAAITNGGGIRATIKAGDITKKDVNTVLPFGNTLSIVKVTGAELLEALEASTYSTPDAIGGFPQVSGIVFNVDTTKPYDAGDNYPGTTYARPRSINRVTIQSVGGKAFNLKTTYSIATNDFMAAGGDTYYSFVTASANYDLGIPMDEVLMDYIKTELKGVVSAKEYKDPASRITIKVNPFTDVAATSKFKDAILWAVDEGITNGTSATTFSPNNTCTHNHILTFIWRAKTSPAVMSSADFEKAIAWAKANGLADENVVGTAPCTRDQAMVYLWKLADSPKVDTKTNFTDMAGHEECAEAVAWAVSKGITTGTTATTFGPTNPCTRGHIMTFLYREMVKAA